MGWDPSRRVPWPRLLREGALFLAIGGLLFAFFIDGADAASYVGLVVGAVLFVLLSASLAKLGYERQTLRQLRERSPRRTATAAPAAPATAVRSRPAPTRRTSSGPSQRPHRTNRARRR